MLAEGVVPAWGAGSSARPFASLPGNWHTAAAMPLLAYSKSSDRPASSVEQRDLHPSCTEWSCKPSGGAAAWQRQSAIARSAGKRAAQYAPTSFPDRGRQASG